MIKVFCNNILIGYILGLSCDLFNTTWKSGGLLKMIEKTSWWLQNIYYFKYCVRLIVHILCFLSIACFYALGYFLVWTHLAATSHLYIWSFSQTAETACFGSGYLHSPSGIGCVSISHEPLVSSILIKHNVENSFGKAVSFLLLLPMPGANGCL